MEEFLTYVPERVADLVKASTASIEAVFDALLAEFNPSTDNLSRLTVLRW